MVRLRQAVARLLFFVLKAAHRLLLLYGPAPKQVVEGYAYLTGTPPLPPLWALASSSRAISYTPESKVREIADRLRTDKNPFRRTLS